MIQSPSLSVLSLIPAAGDLSMPTLPEGVELADFGALLAQTIAPAAVPTEGEATPLPQTTIPAAPLSEAAIGGKLLPVSLPLAVPVMDPERPAAKPTTDAPDPADLPPVVQLPLAKSVIPVQPPYDEGKDKVLPDPDCLPKGELGTIAPVVIEPVPALPHPAAPALVPVKAVPAALPTEPDQDETEALPRRGPAPQPAAAALEHAAPRAAYLRQVFPARRGGEQGAPLAPQAAHPATPQPPTPQPAIAAPKPIAQVRIEVTPAVPVMRALPKEEVRPASGALSTELPATLVSTSAPVASTAPVPFAHQPMPLADRPQDFSALIDRLVAAREAAGPQAVAVNVAHADFGQVHLRFRQDDAGLSVAMASADPAFARAASAMTPVLPVSDTQSGQFQNGQRQDSSAAPGQSGTGQQRGSTGERQGDQPHSNHTPRHAQPEKQQRRAGIFA